MESELQILVAFLVCVIVGLIGIRQLFKHASDYDMRNMPTLDKVKKCQKK